MKKMYFIVVVMVVFMVTSSISAFSSSRYIFGDEGDEVIQAFIWEDIKVRFYPKYFKVYKLVFDPSHYDFPDNEIYWEEAEIVSGEMLKGLYLIKFPKKGLFLSNRKFLDD